MRPMQPDEQLAAVVGDRPMPRTEITKRLWDYIKKNNLQDPQQRRNIIADDKLRPLFGGKKWVTMFDLTKLVNQHLRSA
ncbi:MAG: SWIB/MDM2 domain-containing protein [Gemmatimonadota bacterium]|nr:SWIB/MDM2 domain-containing protein [Gemmatimonadota bacterium]